MPGVLASQYSADLVIAQASQIAHDLAGGVAGIGIAGLHRCRRVFTGGVVIAATATGGQAEADDQQTKPIRGQSGRVSHLLSLVFELYLTVPCFIWNFTRFYKTE